MLAATRTSDVTQEPTRSVLVNVSEFLERVTLMKHVGSEVTSGSSSLLWQWICRWKPRVAL